MTERNQTIDIAKGAGILLVVLGHNPLVWQEKGELYRVIFSFHMPLFFFLSGVFLNPAKGWGETAREKADALLKPYFVTLLPLVVFGALFKGEPIGAPLMGLLYGTGRSIPWDPLWFLPHLLLVTLLSWGVVNLVLNRIRSETGRFAVILGMLVAGVLSIRAFWPGHVALLGTDQLLFGLPWSLDLVLVTAFYYLLGHLCARRVKEFRPGLVSTTVALGLFVGCHVFWDQTIDLNNRRFDGLLVPLVASVCGIHLVLSASHAMSGQALLRRLFAKLGAASLFVLMFHWLFQGKAIGLASKFGLGSNPWALLFAFLVGSGCPVLLWQLVKRSRHLSVLYLPLKVVHQGATEKEK